MSEFSRARLRIMANYGRLFAVVCLGLLLVRLLLRSVGDEAFGLIALLASTVGIAAIIEDMVESSMVRELGAAHHAGDARRFRQMFSSASCLCVAAAVAVLLLYAGIWLALPLLEISDGMMVAARWFVVAKSVESIMTVLLAPWMAMYLVTERMIAWNFWIVARRASLVGAALLLLWRGPENPAAGLIFYGWWAAGLHGSVMLLGSVVAVALDRRCIPVPSMVNWAASKEILTTSGWNVAVLSAQLLEIPAGHVIMNLALGARGNMIFALATQLGGYVRMVAGGLTGGIDAVAARLSTRHDGSSRESTMQKLVHHATRLQALVAVPAMVGMILIASDLLEIWVGEDLQHDRGALTEAAALTRILAVGFFVKCMVDIWTRMLFGSGHVHRYAPALCGGALGVMVFAAALAFTLPAAARYVAPALAFSLVYTLFHLNLIPAIVARIVGMRWRSVMSLLVRPLIVAVAATPALLVVDQVLPEASVLALAAKMLAYAVAYGVLSWFITLGPEDRSRLLGARPRATAAQESLRGP